MTFWRTLTINLIGTVPVHLTAERHGIGFRAMVLYQIARRICRPEVSPAEVSTIRQLVESLLDKTNPDFLPTWTEVLDFSTALRGDENVRRKAIGSALATAKKYLKSL